MPLDFINTAGRLAIATAAAAILITSVSGFDFETSAENLNDSALMTNSFDNGLSLAESLSSSLLSSSRFLSSGPVVDGKEIDANMSTVMSTESAQFGPENVALSTPVSSTLLPPYDVLPTIHSGIDVIDTSSTSLNLYLTDEDPKEAEHNSGFSPTEVVVIAICVSLLSLVIVVLSVVMTFLIRRRMRQKAYLRVKHASQTELCIHLVQNTPASVAARDAAMEQLFQSLASMNPDGQNNYQVPHVIDDRCLSPTESIASEDLIGGKSRTYSRSMPSLKNLNAHEEALKCNFTITPMDSGKMKGRSRSFTEKGIFGIDMMRGKGGAVRSNSEKSRNRITIEAPVMSGKRFEKKSNKLTNRRSTPSFSRLAKFGLIKGSSSKRKQADDGKEMRIPQVASESVMTTNVRDVSETVESKRYSNSLLDFEMPCVSPILQDITPMFTSLQVDSCDPRDSRMSLQSGPQDDTKQQGSEVKICINLELPKKIANGDSNGKKVASFEEVRDGYLHGRGKHRKEVAGNGAIESARKNFHSVGHLETSSKKQST